MPDDEGYRDDGYDRDDRPPQGGSNKMVWIVLGVIGGVMLLGLAACGGLMYVGYRAAKDAVGKIQDATGAAETFLTDLQGNRVGPAYRATSAGFKAGQTEEQFTKFVAKHPALTGHTTRSATAFNTMQMGGVEKMRVQYTLTAANTSTTCTLTLVEENGTWVVDSFTVP